MDTPSRQGRLVDRAAGSLLAGYIRLVARTSEPPPLLERFKHIMLEAHPFILAMWHGQFMLLPSLMDPRVETRAMLALHRDAELMAVALRRFGVELIRGAGAGVKGRDKGGARAFRSAVDALASGVTVAMTADVPPGPARRAGHGIVTLAKVSGRPIIPLAIATDRYVALNTWSRMTINLPGGKMGASFGEPIHVPPDASPEALEVLRRRVEEQLDVATVDAYARADADPTRATPPRVLVEAGKRLPVRGRLRAYRRLTRWGTLVAPSLLDYRERRGKEDGSRRGERFGKASQERPEGRLLWLHAASVGETNAILPLIGELRVRRPDLALLLTTGTVTSARLAATRLPAGVIHQYVPLDSPRYVRSFLDHWQPDVAVFTESEIWPNLILETSARSTPIAVVNARMSKKSFGSWRRNAGMAHALFGRIDIALAQNRVYALRYNDLGVRRTLDAGNLKIDAPPLPIDRDLLADLHSAIGQRPVWLAASTHEGEEVIVGRAHRRLIATHGDALTIIAPRHPERGPAIAAQLEGMGLSVARRSAGERPQRTTDVYLADTLGELGTFFALVPVGFIGKSLIENGGGHNPIEGVRHGVAVLTGPSQHNFADAFGALFEAGGALEVKDEEELAAALHRLLQDPAELTAIRAKAEAALSRLGGALENTLAVLLDLLEGNDGAGKAAAGQGAGGSERAS
jgi:3-deoxy-D-manno-octulosonic-acid transferase